MTSPHSVATHASYTPKPQVPTEVYDQRYLHPGRVANYAQQLMEVLRANPQTVLEIGIASGFMRGIAERHQSASWVTCDIDLRLRPSVVGSVSDLPFRDNAFDMVICCQVLEHLPFSYFERCLGELARVTRKYVIISLPDVRRYYAVCLCLPKLGWVRKEFNIERFGQRTFTFQGEHYWEIGYTGSRWRQVKRSIIASGLAFVHRMRLPTFAYHHFMVLSSS